MTLGCPTNPQMSVLPTPAAPESSEHLHLHPMLRSVVLLVIVTVAGAYRLPARPVARAGRAPAAQMIDTDVLIGAGTLVGSVGLGIGLISAVESAGEPRASGSMRRAPHPAHRTLSTQAIATTRLQTSRFASNAIPTALSTALK